MICHQVTLSGDAEWSKVADAMIEALYTIHPWGSRTAMGSPLPSYSLPLGVMLRYGTAFLLHVVDSFIPGMRQGPLGLHQGRNTAPPHYAYLLHEHTSFPGFIPRDKGGMMAQPRMYDG
jgi:hypothetical protein